MKIVVLDTCTVSRGDLDFSRLERLGEVQYFDMPQKDEEAALCVDADVLIVNKTEVGEPLLSRCPKLKLVCMFATGFNNIDIAAAAKYGIGVCNVPDYSTFSVSQHVFGMLLNFVCSTDKYERFVDEGGWIVNGSFSWFDFPIEELWGKTFGIFGYGAIGKRVAKIADALGMKVIFCNRSHVQSPFEQVSFDELLQRSDFLSLHCPLTEQTKLIVNSESLAKMKTGAVLINTARGGLVDEAALVQALESGKLRASLLDVVTREPMDRENVLLGAKNCFITPHVGWAGLSTRQRVVDCTADNVASFFDGKPQNVVNGVLKVRE